MTPLDAASIAEIYPGRWAALETESEEAQEELAWYVATRATQDELRAFVAAETGQRVRRVLYTGPDGEPVPGWLYLDYGITLVPSVPARAKLPPGGMRRDEILAVVRKLHRHFPKPPPTYLWAYLIYNGHAPEPENLIGAALVGVPGPHAAAQEKAGMGPRIATVTRVALDHWLPQEITYRASSAVYDAAAEEAHRRGYDFLETYTLASEHGRSLRYSNWSAPGISKTQSRWRKVGWARPRKKSRRGEVRTPEQAQAKWRWWKRLTPTWPWPPAPVEGKRNPGENPGEFVAAEVYVSPRERDLSPREARVRDVSIAIKDGVPWTIYAVVGENYREDVRPDEWVDTSPPKKKRKKRKKNPKLDWEWLESRVAPPKGERVKRNPGDESRRRTERSLRAGDPELLTRHLVARRRARQPSGTGDWALDWLVNTQTNVDVERDQTTPGGYTPTPNVLANRFEGEWLARARAAVEMYGAYVDPGWVNAEGKEAYFVGLRRERPETYEQRAEALGELSATLSTAGFEVTQDPWGGPWTTLFALAPMRERNEIMGAWRPYVSFLRALGAGREILASEPWPG